MNSENEYMGPRENEEIHFADYVRVIRKRLTMFLAIFVMVTAAGITYTFMSTPVYQAEIKLEILDSPEEEISLLSTLGGLKSDRIETEIEKIRSRDIAREVAENLKLKKTIEPYRGDPAVVLSELTCRAGVARLRPRVFYVTFHGTGYEYSVLDEGKDLVATGTGPEFNSDHLSFRVDIDSVGSGDTLQITCRHIEACVDELMRTASVFRIGETSIVGISVKHTSPATARNIVDEYFRVYSLRNLAEKNASAREVNRFISERKAFYRNKKEGASQALQAFKEKNNIFSLDSKNSALIMQVADRETRKAVKSVELDRIDNAITMVQDETGNDTTPEIFPPQSGLEQLSARLSMLKVSREKLLTNLTLDHPKVVDVEVQIRKIKEEIINKLQATRKNIQQELVSIKEQIDAYDEEMKALPELDRDMVEKIRDVRFYEEMELQMATKSEEFSIIEVSTLSSVRVSQESIVPDVPVKPRKSVNIILTAVVAAVCGLGAVFMREYFDNSFVSTEDIEEFLKYKVLVTVPFVKKRFSNDIRVERREGLAYLSSDSPITEAFRTLKTSVEFLDMGRTPKVYQISSSVAGEGKSTVSANLAITCANSGLKTLLIDGDHRKPTLDQILTAENDIGFVDIIYRDVPAEELVQSTVIPNLDFIPSGRSTSDLIRSIDFNRLTPQVEALKKIYDYIFIDSPPLLAIDDANRIARLVDGVILVVALGKVDRIAAKRCLGRCRQNGVNIAGLVANDCLETERYIRNYSYYQYYPYRDKTAAKESIEKKWRILIKR